MKRMAWLCVAPVVMCLFDTAVTLYFQPAAYWAGDYARVNEFSPVDRWMLGRHPGLFAAWVMVWITAFCIAILKLPTRIALGIALFLLINNTAGAASWLGRRFPEGGWVQIGLYAVTAALVILTWSRAGVFGTRQMPPP